MHPIRRALVVAAIVLVGASSTGCTTDAEPTPSVPSTSATTPTAPSRAEAFAQARATYAGYLRAIEVMGAEGKEDIEALRPFVVTESLDDEVEAIRTLAAGDLRFSGRTELVEFEFQAYDPQAQLLTAYSCLDLSGIRVVDADGEDVTPETRPDRQTSVPNFRVADGSVKLIEDANWTGDPIC